ncbi:galactoside alpha-(1,2)-fucosyltransferase 2 [Lepeophtheirus salmonis]|uniref:galactoside alpha-(1,2)-fucosyltransferase 2 n=1 Tax=Lepeophtheirus salmonis TaxID=72036 RepID=UPI001AE5E29D|nr:uncharacterized protein LOC121117554 [Lepeophtheirus salmonis]
MIVFFLFFIIYALQCTMTKILCDHNGKCVEFEHQKWISAMPTSIVVIQPNGRMGNHLISFALIQALRHKFDAYIMNETFHFISETFEINNQVIEIPILEKIFCSPEKMKFEHFDGSIQELLKDDKLHRGKILNLWPNGYKPDAKICCPTNELMEFILKDKNPPILSTLQCKADIQKTVQVTLGDISKKRRILSNLPPLFIGIHDRRTDYNYFMENKYGLKQLKKSYYTAGMEYFEDEFSDEFDVIFIWVSDQPSWGRQKFKNKKNLYFRGNADQAKPSEDFCLLTSCNHTIMTRGTFTTFASILTQGEIYTEYGITVPSYLQNKKKRFKI